MRSSICITHCVPCPYFFPGPSQIVSNRMIKQNIKTQLIISDRWYRTDMPQVSEARQNRAAPPSLALGPSAEV